MFEAGRKNTFAEGTIGQFSYEFREKIRTSLNNGGWDTVSGRSFSWTGCENSVDLSGADRRNVSEEGQSGEDLIKTGGWGWRRA